MTSESCACRSRCGARPRIVPQPGGGCKRIYICNAKIWSNNRAQLVSRLSRRGVYYPAPYLLYTKLTVLDGRVGYGARLRLYLNTALIPGGATRVGSNPTLFILSVLRCSFCIFEVVRVSCELNLWCSSVWKIFAGVSARPDGGKRKSRFCGATGTRLGTLGWLLPDYPLPHRLASSPPFTLSLSSKICI
jgi:hypothetical protein